MGVYEVAKEVVELAAGSGNAELTRTASEALAQVAELVSEDSELRSRLRDLQEALRFQEELRPDRNMLWAEGDEVPFCRVCWESEGKALHLSYSPKYAAYHCQTCQSACLAATGDEPPPLVLKILHGLAD